MSLTLQRTALDLKAEIEAQYSVFHTLKSFPTFSRMPEGDLMTIIVTAQALGLSPFLALQKRLYAIDGKVEIDSQIMNRLIRQAGHSIKTLEHTETVCILEGTRADTGDTMQGDFTWADAEKAGLAGKFGWKKFPKDMLFARALSRLARRLFPDVIQGCYVLGEISEQPARIDENIIEIREEPTNIIEIEDETPRIDEDQAADLVDLLKQVPDYYKQVQSIAKDMGINANLIGLPVQHANAIHTHITKLLEEANA